MGILNTIKKASGRSPEKATKSKSEKTAIQPKAPSSEQKVAAPLKDDTKFAYRVLKSAHLTEKASQLKNLSQYIFRVPPTVTKVQIREAVQSVYGKNPIKVNIVNVKGKKVARGKWIGKQSHWTKAIVSLKKGESIDV